MAHLSDNGVAWLRVLLEERFGLALRLSRSTFEGQPAISLLFEGVSGEICFCNLQERFCQPGTSFLPSTLWNAESEGFKAPIEPYLPAPGVERVRQPLIERHNQRIVVRYDLLGLMYWMLSRVEELGAGNLDAHGRYPSTASHAYRHGYIDRPLIDEWLHIIEQVIRQHWPGLPIRRPEFQIRVSHDVDEPGRYAFLNWKKAVRRVGEDILVRGNYRSALLGYWMNLWSKKRIHPQDPGNTFDWLMTQSEKNGITSAFYFISGRTNAKMDAGYNLTDPSIRELLKRIHDRGHEIGLHPSYETYQRPDLIKAEAHALQNTCEEEGIGQAEWGGRMHYLRWDQRITPGAWENAGLAYDSTLGFADRPGFRCGTCHEYPAFDPVQDRQLTLRFRPLIAMDCTVMADRYLGLGYGEQAFQEFARLKDRCREVGGSFTLLWHNTYFWHSDQFQLYQRLLAH